MQEMKQIYYNESTCLSTGEKRTKLLTDKVQLIFRETWFYFSRHELKLFQCCIQESYIMNNCCDDCALKINATNFLKHLVQIDLAVSMEG
jgi:hypothetical protein